MSSLHPRIAELLDYVDVQRTNMRAVVTEIPQSKLDRTPPSGGWTILGVLDHVSNVEARIAALIRNMAAEARAAGAPLESETSSILGQIDVDRFLDRTRKLDAPQSTQPRGGMTLPALWTQLEATRADLRGAVGTANGLALGALSFPHRYFGPLDLYAWIALVGAHDARHTDQVREIASCLDAAG